MKNYHCRHFGDLSESVSMVEKQLPSWLQTKASSLVSVVLYKFFVLAAAHAVFRI
jgi:hypothetical protein